LGDRRRVSTEGCLLKPLGKVNPMTKLAEEFEKLNTLHGGLDALQKRMQEEVEDE
jgi:hypothetical protein